MAGDRFLLHRIAGERRTELELSGSLQLHFRTRARHEAQTDLGSKSADDLSPMANPKCDFLAAT